MEKTTKEGIPADTRRHHAYHECSRSKRNQMTMPPTNQVMKSQVELQTKQPREETDEARRRGGPQPKPTKASQQEAERGL